MHSGQEWEKDRERERDRPEDTKGLATTTEKRKKHFCPLVVAERVLD